MSSTQGRATKAEILSPQQAKWLEGRAAGLSPVDAAKAAGYSDPYNAAYRLTRNATLFLLNQAVGAAHGVDIAEIFLTIKRNLNAKKYVKATFQGSITDERWVEDGDIQLRAAQLAMDLLGLKPVEELRLVRDDDGDGDNGLMVPDEFEDMDEATLLQIQQRRRQEMVAGQATQRAIGGKK